MRRFAPCILLAILISAAGCQNKAPVNVTPFVQNEELAKAGLAYYWQLDMLLNGGETVTKIWRVDENVYCLTSCNRVMAYDAARGLPKWSAQIASAESTVFSPGHANQVLMPPNPGAAVVINPPPRESLQTHNIVIFTTGTSAVILDRHDGQVLARLDFDRAGVAANTGAACDGQFLYVGSLKGWYYAIELTTGVASWWRDAGGMISADPVFFNRSLFVGSTSGTMVAASTSTRGNELWRQATEGSFSSDFVVEDRGIFAGNMNYNVYAFDSAIGKVVWKFACGGPVIDPVQAGVNNVYALARSDKFYALDVASGRAKWALPTGLMVLMERNNTAYVLDRQNELMVTDAATGKVATIIPMTGLDLYVRNTYTPAIYAAGKHGKLCCIQPAEAGYLTEERLRTSTPPPAPVAMPTSRPAAPPAAPETPAPATPPSSDNP